MDYSIAYHPGQNKLSKTRMLLDIKKGNSPCSLGISEEGFLQEDGCELFSFTYLPILYLVSGSVVGGRDIMMNKPNQTL